MRNYSPQSWRSKRDFNRSYDKKMVYSLSGKKFPSLKQLRYASHVLSPIENWILRILAGFLIICIVFLGWKGYEANTVEVPKVGGQYTEGVVGTPQYVNPILFRENDVDRDISSLVYSGLMRYDNNRKIVPDLAERYELGADAKTYTFFLRKDVTWHDGTPFNADDVVFTIQKIQDTATQSPLVRSFQDVKIEKVDDYTVRFVLARPFSPFLDLTTIGILPQHVWGEVASANMALDGKNLKPIGTGPWKFKSLQKGKEGDIRSYLLERNDKYYGQKPYLKTLTFKMYPDVDSVVQALKNRNVEGISFLPRELRDKLKQDKDLKYYTFNLPQYTAVFFNQTANADLKSKAVRQALALSVDRDRIVREVLAGEGRTINGPILPGFLGYDELVKTYPFDTEKARDLLQAAGWKRGDDGIWAREDKVVVEVPAAPVDPKKKDDKKKTDTKPEKTITTQKHQLSITLVTVNQPEQAKVAQIVKEGWADMGVKVELQLVDPSRIKTDVIDTRSYDAFVYGEIIGSDPDLYPFWHSSQARKPGLNLAVYANTDADKLLEEGRQISDEGQRATRYQKFQQILAEEVPAIFLYYPTYNYVVASSIHGIGDGKEIVYPSDRFVDLGYWYAASKRVFKK